MSQVILSVPDISCAHCEKTVVGALQGKPGVKSVQVDIPAKVVYLEYDPETISLQQVGEILDEEGYEVASSTEGAPPAARRGFIPLTGK